MMLRWSLSHPDEAGKIGDRLWEEVAEIIPSILTSTGAYLLSSYLASKLGLPKETVMERPALPPLFVEPEKGAV
jgi:hypothetical protein